MAASPGDLLLDLFGQSDPRQKIAAVLNAGMNPNPAPASASAPAPPVPSGQGGIGSDANASSPPQQNQQQQQTPEAYQSPPDIANMLFELQRRQSSAESINRGLGMLFAGFARPEDRASMVGAMSGMSGGGTGGGSMEDMMKLYGGLQAMSVQRNMYRMAPVYAQQLGIPVEQVIAYIQAGKLQDVMAAVQKQKAELTTPHAQSEIDQANAAAAASRASAGKTAAETGEVVPKAEAEIGQAKAAAASSQAEADTKTALLPGVVPAQEAATAKTQADTLKAQQDAAKAAAEAAARQKLSALAQDPDFTKKYGVTPAQAQAMNPDDWAKLIATGPQEVAKTVSTEQAKTQQGAKTQLDSLRGDYDKQQALINDITNNPVLDEITGKVAGRLPSTIAPFISGKTNSQEAINLQQKVDQLSHMGFLAGAHAVREAVGARVSNVEAVAGNAAETRLRDQTQSSESYREAIKQVKDESDRNMAIAYKQAGIPIPDDLPDVKKAAEKLNTGTGPASGAQPRHRKYDSNGVSQ